MFRKKIYIIELIVMILLFGIMLIIYFDRNKKPEEIIKNKINLTLPLTAEIFSFEYNTWSESFYTKILINNKDLEKVRSDLLWYFTKEYDIKGNNYIPIIENTVSWWDMDDSNIAYSYYTAKQGVKKIFVQSAKTQEVWAFIVKQSDKGYQLYIACY